MLAIFDVVCSQKSPRSKPEPPGRERVGLGSELPSPQLERLRSRGHEALERATADLINNWEDFSAHLDMSDKPTAKADSFSAGGSACCGANFCEQTTSNIASIGYEPHEAFSLTSDVALDRRL